MVDHIIGFVLAILLLGSPGILIALVVMLMLWILFKFIGR